MSNLDAWQYIINHWNCVNWQALPLQVTKALGLDSRLGICGGMLVTRIGNNGIVQTVKAMNEKYNKKG